MVIIDTYVLPYMDNYLIISIVSGIILIWNKMVQESYLNLKNP